MSKSKKPPADPPPSGIVPICAIGASAGGVGALQTLFRLLPDDLGLAYVVVVHLSPDHPSAMHDILAAAPRCRCIRSRTVRRSRRTASTSSRRTASW